MRFTETITILSCDRCDTRVDERDGIPHGWLVANVALSEAPTAVVTHHLCPSCREALGGFLATPEAPQRDLIERLADILYPMDGYADDQWNGADVCDELAALLHEVAPWASKRQPASQEGAFEAYQRERERLGL